MTAAPKSSILMLTAGFRSGFSGRKTGHISYISPNIWRFLMIQNISSREKEYFSLANQAEKVITVSLAGRRAFQAAGVEYQKLATVYNGVKSETVPGKELMKKSASCMPDA